MRSRKRRRTEYLSDEESTSEEGECDFILTQHDVERHTDQQSLDRADSYIGSFHNMRKSDDGISGSCHGYSTGMTYEVHISSSFSGSCTCPSWYNWCKHTAALGLTYIQSPEDFTMLEDKESIRKRLTKMKKSELIELILDAIDSHPELRDEI